jgi:hypothetical protein
MVVKYSDVPHDRHFETTDFLFEYSIPKYRSDVQFATNGNQICLTVRAASRPLHQKVTRKGIALGMREQIRTPDALHAI